MLKIALLSALAFGFQIANAEIVSLGTARLSDDAGRVAVAVNNACGVRRLALTARGNHTRAHVTSVTLHYRNGATTLIRANMNLDGGESTGWATLPKPGRCITRVTVNGRSRIEGRSARIQIIGDIRRGGNDDGDDDHDHDDDDNNGGGNQVIGQARISTANSFRYTFVRPVCGLDQVRIRVAGDSANIQYLGVRFDNGAFQRVNIRENFRQGSASAWKDLNGRNRCVNAFLVVGSADSDNARVTLIGR